MNLLLKNDLLTINGGGLFSCFKPVVVPKGHSLVKVYFYRKTDFGAKKYAASEFGDGSKVHWSVFASKYYTQAIIPNESVGFFRHIVVLKKN